MIRIRFRHDHTVPEAVMTGSIYIHILHVASLVTRSLSSCEVYSSSSYSVMAIAASPAVSVRKVVFPKETDLPPASTICWASFSEKPPSGPMMMAMFSGLADFPALPAAVAAAAPP